MLSVFSALGLFNSTEPLPTDKRRSAIENNGFSCSWVVPFGARAYIEKMACGNSKVEKVRILVNDRVMPMKTCKGDAQGRCDLDDFVKSLSFATEGGRWSECFLQ